MPISSALIGGAIRQHLSASVAGSPSINGHPCMFVRRAFSCKGKARAIQSPTVLRLKTDAPVMELMGIVPDAPGSTAVLTLLVNGQLVPAKALATSRPESEGGWAFVSVKVDFGSREIRDIRLYTSMPLALVRMGPGDTLLPIDAGYEPQLTAVGDSYLQSPSGTFATPGALALEIGARLGIGSVAVDAIGGTGFWNSGTDLGNFNDRLSAHAADGSNLYLVMGGINDYGDVVDPPRLVWPSRAIYEDAVFGYFARLRDALPDTVIVATAPFCPIPPMSDSTYIANPATNSSGLGDYLYKAALHSDALRRIAGPWVYVDVLMGGGWLNSSGKSGDVTNLQWFTGGTPAPGTSASYRPGNTQGGGGGGFNGIAAIPVIVPGRYSRAPSVTAIGGSGQGLLLSSSIDRSGRLQAINVLSPGFDYLPGAGLPSVVIERTYEIEQAILGMPVLTSGSNPDGMYPLPSFAPPGSDGMLNNIHRYLLEDGVHPSPPGVQYLASRLARSMYEAILAL